jgi:hypothetical protein
MAEFAAEMCCTAAEDETPQPKMMNLAQARGCWAGMIIRSSDSRWMAAQPDRSYGTTPSRYVMPWRAIHGLLVKLSKSQAGQRVKLAKESSWSKSQAGQRVKLVKESWQAMACRMTCQEAEQDRVGGTWCKIANLRKSTPRRQPAGAVTVSRLAAPLALKNGLGWAGGPGPPGRKPFESTCPHHQSIESLSLSSWRPGAVTPNLKRSGSGFVFLRAHYVSIVCGAPCHVRPFIT